MLQKMLKLTKIMNSYFEPW